MRLILTLLAVLTLSGATPAHANREEVSGSPYMAVVKDAKGSSKREPGLYKRSHKGDWLPLIMGEVTSLNSLGQYYLPIEGFQSTQKFDSIAVVNGRIHIFNINSDLAHPQSILVVGTSSAGSVGVIDPYSQHRVQVPEIKSRNDFGYINLAESMSVPGDKRYQSGQLLMFSIKGTHVFGDGVTFSVILANHNSSESTPVALGSSFLVESRFRENFELLKRTFSIEQPFKSVGYLSDQLLSRLSVTSETDDAELAQWRTQLKHKSDYLQAETSTTIKDLPRLDLSTGQEVIPRIPSKVLVSQSSREIRYIWDPKGSYSGVYVMPKTDDKNIGYMLNSITKYKCLFSGKVSWKEIGVAPDSYVDMNIGFFIDTSGGLHLIQIPPKADPILISFNQPINGDILDQSFHIDRETETVFLSFKSKAGDKTILYKYVKSHPDGELKITEAMPISNRFFSNTELSYRLTKSRNILFFDSESPHVSSQGAYNAIHDSSAPHVDVLSTIRLRTLIVKPIQATRKTVLLTSLGYQEFKSESSNARLTGLYDFSEDPEKLIGPTQILDPNGIQNYTPGSLVLEKRRVQTDRRDSSNAIEMGVVLGDVTHTNGAEQFQVRILLSSQGQVFDGTIASFKFPVSHLEDIQIYTPVLNGIPSTKMLLLVKIKGDGLYPIPFSIWNDKKLEAKFPASIINGDSFKVETNAVVTTKEGVERRLRYDKFGNIYWVLTEEYSDSEPEFMIRNLTTGEVINHHNMKLDIYQADKPSEMGHGYSSWMYNTSGDGRLAEATSQRYNTDLFSQFKDLLESMADPQKTPQRVVVIVPEEIKTYAENYPLALFHRRGEVEAKWSRTNSALKLFIPNPKYLDQESVLTNLNIMSKSNVSGKTRAFLLATLGQIISHPRPEPRDPNSEKSFTIQESEVSGKVFENQSSSDNTQTEGKIYPHFLYMLLTGGHHISTDKFVGQNFDVPNFSTLILATKEEWGAYIQQESIEDRLNLRKYFKVSALEAPTVQVREQYVKELLARKEIQALGYTFDVSGITNKPIQDQNQAREVIARYFVKRADTLAQENNEPSFEGFVKAIGILTKELQKNTTLRAALKVDRAVIQQILSKVFAMTLNPDLLAPDDIHKKLEDPQAAWKWQQKGYAGPIKFKEDLIAVMRGQLNPSSTQNVASTFILNGESGTGKTQAIRSFFIDFLGLKEFNIRTKELLDPRYSAPDGEIFILHCPSILNPNVSRTATLSERTSEITLDEALKNIDLFFTSARGQRGVLILDDIHDANGPVKEALIKKIRQILDQKNIEAKTAEGELVSVPTRNLTIGLTMNFKPDKDMVKKVAKNDQGPTRDELILATLSTQTAVLDDSFLKRINAVIAMDVHPKDAKAPKLTDELTNAAKSGFLNSQTLTFVSQDVIGSLVDRFPTTDVRTFMDPSEKNLLNGHRKDSVGLLITVPKLDSKSEAPSVTTDSPKEKIAAYINEKTEKLPIESTIRGRVEFMRFMIDRVRKAVFESFLKGLNEDSHYAAGIGNQKNLGAPTAKAIYDHLLTIPSLPIEEMNLNPGLLRVNSMNEKNQFRLIIRSIIEAQRSQIGFQPPKLSNFSSQGLLGDLSWDAGDGIENQRNRRQVAREAMEKLRPITEKVLREMYRVSSLETFPEPEKWIEGLTKTDPTYLTREAGGALVEVLSSYIVEMFDRTIKENFDERSGKSVPKMTTYDSVRIFSLAVDKVLAQMPWEKLTDFMVNNLSFSVQNLDMGHAAALQHLLFESKYSPVVSKHISLVTGHAQVMPFFDKQEQEERGLHRRFSTHCEVLLSGLSESSK